MKFDHIVARFGIAVVVLCLSGVAAGQGMSREWQGISLGAGSAVKQKLEGAQGRAVSLVGRSRSVGQLVDIPALDAWRWRPVISSGSVYRASEQDGLLVLAVGAEVERDAGWVGHQLRPYVAVGFSPTLLSDDELGPVIIGGDFHFTSAVMLGLKVHAPLPFRLAFRLSHTSNGGLRKDNPGVDISGLTVEFPFRLW